MIREFRERWGLTQQELAAALGLGKNRLSDYETGVGAPAWMRYALIGYADLHLGVPREQLGWLGYSDARPADARHPGNSPEIVEHQAARGRGPAARST